MSRHVARWIAPWCVAVAAAALAGCGGGDSGTEPDDDPDPGPEPTYDERVASGWASYEAGQFTAARSAFQAAAAVDGSRADAHVGLGWSQLRLDAPDLAHDAFDDGSAASGSDALKADLHAGWAFAWNARQAAAGRHAESNARVLQAEALAPGWTFAHEAGMDAADLTLLAAENHFALGEFAESLARVQVLDPAFTADVGTAAGLSALAAKIEALRAGS
ncbi:MAG TPA: hypothetical protein VKU85_01075 [bacterium]|nr:hypothetical protein [bacterium]